ncbi:DUF4316 domain-containing protein [Tissierella sp.]|uniref:DUF4316 domain-containing protein n=1 Tax=Tissierella sp. TaxID=41274 RepID=UPI0028B219BF|nr:DUF4316 domain-containing protein [Tissierella sp.]
MIFDLEDIDNHSGIFGIQRTDWIALQDHDNYGLVYTAPLTDFNENQNHTLNKLYEQFNINHPPDFKEQAHFLPAHNYLETAEKTVEQNYNHLNGIINNKPTVADIEKTVKAERKESFCSGKA